MNFRYPLRYVVPLLVLLVGALVIAVAWVEEKHAYRQSLMSMAEQQLRSNASLVAAEIEVALRNQNFARVRATAERTRANPSIESLHLVSPDGRVLYSSDRNLIGTTFGQQQGTREMANHLASKRALTAIEVWSLPREGMLAGRFPIRMRGTPEELIPAHTGTLYIRYDLSRVLAKQDAALSQRMIVRTVIIMAIALGFYLLLRVILLIRIERLTSVLRAVGQGRFEAATVDTRGHDEITDLGREMHRLVATLREQQARLNYLADHDALTGLANRAHFEAAVATALAETRSYDAHFALCLLDIDNLRVINDTQGHIAGDEVLREFASLLQEQLPHAAALARIGGGAFAALISIDHSHSLEELGLKQLAPLREFRFERLGERFVIQVTTGIITLDEELDDPAQALGAADAACYRAKEKQRGSVHFGTVDSMRTDLLEGSMRWVSRIHEALDEDRFTLFAQPIQPLAELSATGLHFEVLIRMLDRDEGLVPPGHFLRAAERYNLMGRIDRWVVQHTLDLLVKYHDRGLDIATCSINLSGASLADQGLLADIGHWLEQRPQLQPGILCFEVTETAAIRNFDHAQQFLTQLRHFGCRFALDDFGTGLSSFEYIKRLPVDLVKIDGTFIRDLVKDPTDRAIVTAINAISHQLGMKTIAEFVDSRAIIAELENIGVDFAQGFEIARPAPLEDLLRSSPRKPDSTASPSVRAD